MRTNKGFTIMELMVVVALFTILFSGFIGVMINSDMFFSKGEKKISEQEEARKAMDAIATDLRFSNTYWGVTINTNEITFLRPSFNNDSEYTGTYWVKYKLNPSNPTQLLRGEGAHNSTASSVEVIANNVTSIDFNGSTDACVTYNSTTVPSSCPRVSVTITTHKEHDFILNSIVSLRNQVIDTQGEGPAQGAF